jgi:hypothetical protein
VKEKILKDQTILPFKTASISNKISLYKNNEKVDAAKEKS